MIKISWASQHFLGAGHTLDSGFPLALENGENKRSFSSQGKVREFWVCQGKISQKIKKIFYMAIIKILVSVLGPMSHVP